MNRIEPVLEAPAAPAGASAPVTFEELAADLETFAEGAVRRTEPVVDTPPPPREAAPAEPAPPAAAPEPLPVPVPAAPPPPVAAPAPSAAPSSPAAESATMVPWITTKQFTVDLFPSWTKTEGDKEWSLGAVTVDVPQIASRLDQLIASLNEDQWEIKMVVPLDKSLTYHEHQKVVRAGNRREPEAVLGAFGLGWAAGTTASLLIVCQRTEWLDASEYKARIKVRQDKLDAETRAKDRAAALEHNAAVNAKITNAQRLLESMKANGLETRRTGLLRTEKFVVAGVEYTNRTEAEAAFRARIGELEADLAALPKQLRPVSAEA